ncbi:MAG TPA: hypothetical protein VM910_24075, partial [Bradyrhizobium sp.]|nr:hypothetical protein [Bradyrhizobium sp.]
AIDHHGITPMRFRLFIIGQLERSAIMRGLLRRPTVGFNAALNGTAFSFLRKRKTPVTRLN